MKKGKKLAALALSAMLVISGTAMVALSGCGEKDNPDSGIETPQKTLSGISITTPPTKTEYTAGETFDKTGMVVTATYSDNSKEAVTNYSVDKTTLAVDDTAVTITYEGKTAIQAITVVAKQKQKVITFVATNDVLNFYDDGTCILMENTEYPTTFNWSLGSDGVIVIDAGMYASYVEIKTYNVAGKANVQVDSSKMGGANTIYSVSIKDYKRIFDLDTEVVGTVTNGENVLKLYDTGTYEMTLNGAKTTGEVVYTEAEGSNKASLVLKPDSGEDIVATTGAYDSNFTISETFVIPDGRLRNMLGYTIAAFTNDDVELYFFDDSSVAMIIEVNGSYAEYPCSFAYDNLDITALSLEISCSVPSAYGGPILSCVYDEDEDAFTFTCTPQSYDFSSGTMAPGTPVTLIIDGQKANDALKNYVASPILYEIVATSAQKADGTVVDGSSLKFLIKKGSCEVTMYNQYTQTEMSLGTGAWQYSEDGGFGFMLSGSYVKFTHGGLNADNLSITIETEGMSSISTITFTLTAEQWAEMIEAIS